MRKTIFTFICLTFSVAVFSQINATAVIKNLSCNKVNIGSITQTVSGGITPYTYIWSSGQTSKDIKNIAAGEYMVEIKDANGVKLLKTYTVTEPAPLTIETIIDKTSICAGQTTFVVAIPSGGTTPYSYVWNDPLLQRTYKASNLGGGNYTVTVTDNNNCVKTASVNIFESPAMTVSANSINNVKCKDAATGSITLAIQGGKSPFTYIWSNNQTASIAQNLVAGSYSVTVKDNVGCESSKSFSITQPNEPFLIDPNLVDFKAITCHGGADGYIKILLDVFTGYSAKWTNSNGQAGYFNSNLQTLSLQAGNYNVSVYNPDNCEFKTSVSLNQPLDILIDSTDVQIPPGSDTATIRIFGAGGSGILLYSIDGGVNFYDNNGVFDQVLPGTYPIAVKDINGCVKQGSTIKINKSGDITANEALTLDENDNANQPFDIYPNPSTGLFNIMYRNSQKEVFVVDITDLNGKKVYSQAIDSKVNVVWLEVDLQAKAKGVYLVAITSATNKLMQKVILK